jgi:upstream activation factor subunit UAF30
MAKKKTSAKKASPKKVAKSKTVAKNKTVKTAAPTKQAPKQAPKKVEKESKSKAPAVKPARKPNAAFMVALTPSSALAEVIGQKPLPRTEIIRSIWDYIRKNGLQDKVNKRMINADSKLKVIFDGKDQISMFELAKVVNNHVKK